jgi:hypothetical protein
MPHNKSTPGWSNFSLILYSTQFIPVKLSGVAYETEGPFISLVVILCHVYGMLLLSLQFWS